ncbi:MAG: GntR family transcriptional regulator [Nocardioides alkalitolerans]
MPEHPEAFARAVRRSRPDRGGTAKYLAICRDVTEAIESGRLAPGSPLPSQKEMADHFGVTVMTLRQALGVLSDQGLLRVEHGRGTFVARRPYRLPIDVLTSFRASVEARGSTMGTQILSAEVVPAPPGVPVRMGLATDQVFALTRLRTVDGVPFVYTMSLLPVEIGTALRIDEVGGASLYDALAEQLGLRVDRAVETFHATAMATDAAAALGRSAGSPALVSSRITFTAEGVAVVDDRAIMPGDAVEISTERRVHDLPLQLVPTSRPDGDGAVGPS